MAFAHNEEVYQACRQGSTWHLQRLRRHVDFSTCTLRTQDGTTTPLHVALSWGRKEAVMFLLDHGANANAHDSNGRPAWEVALRPGKKISDARKQSHEQIVAHVMSLCDDPDSALHCSVAEGHLDIAALLVRRGANVNARDRCGRSPLEVASANRDANMVKFLSDVAVPWKPERHAALPLVAGRQNVVAVFALAQRDACQLSRLPLELLFEVFAILFQDRAVRDVTAISPELYRGNMERVREVVAAGAAGAFLYDVPLEGFMMSPLHVAAGWGSVGVARFLVEEMGADVNARVRETPPVLWSGWRSQAELGVGSTPLMRAVQSRFQNVVEYLLSQGADASARNARGLSALNVADLKMARVLVRHGADAKAANDARLKAMAPWGVAENLSQFLTTASVDPARAELEAEAYEQGWVEKACYEGDVAKLRTVLADVGPGAFGYCSVLSSPEISHHRVTTCLHVVVCYGHVEAARFLIEDVGMDVDCRDQHDWTPLFVAISAKQLSAAELLIAHGADVNAISRDRENPLRRAMKQSSFTLARLLIQHGAIIENLWFPPMMTGESHANLAVVEFLREATIDRERALKEAAANEQVFEAAKAGDMTLLRGCWGSDCRTDYMLPFEHASTTALHVAARFGHRDAAQFLIEEAGFDVDTRDSQQWTPLMDAAYSGRVDVVEYLLARGAEIAAVDGLGRTALHRTVDSDNVEAARVLVRHGADLRAKDRDGQTPHVLATRTKHESIRKFLRAAPRELKKTLTADSEAHAEVAESDTLPEATPTRGRKRKRGVGEAESEGVPRVLPAKRARRTVNRRRPV